MKKSFFITEIFAILFLQYFALADYPDQPFTDRIIVKGKKIKLEDGIDLSNKHLDGIQIGRRDGTLKNVDFSNSYMFEVDLRETNFENCNFSKARLVRAKFEGSVAGCNFTDADIGGAAIGGLNAEQLKSTSNYKKKQLSYIQFWFIPSDFSGVDFSGVDLSNVIFFQVRLDKCNFTNAKIKNAKFEPLHNKGIDIDFRIEQLLDTKDFKEGFVEGVEITQVIWPKDKTVNLSNMVFVNCILGSEGLAKISLTDSVISGCNFCGLKGLTLENVKSTWNYKHNRMEGIKLPEEIQKALDAEKKK